MKSCKAFLFLPLGLAHGLSIPSYGRDLLHEARSKLSSILPRNTPLKSGYVAFGDSYAAGIGTGTTDGGGCRRGEFSYPALLHGNAPKGVDFQNLPCSGAVVTDILKGEPKSQIDKWEAPLLADRATLSIGGNDIGFYNIVTSCVARYEQAFAGDCDHYVNKAYEIMNAPELSMNIETALLQILTKSGRPDFKVVQTGYPTFFNDQTDICDYSTFYFWNPGHHAFHHLGDWAYLYKARRSKLNKLVSDLNAMLKKTVDKVNQGKPSKPVIWVDPNEAFNGHRFCEPGVIEPEASRMDTWLFLSAWGDNSLPGSNTAAASNASELAESLAIIAGQEKLTIPDAKTCATSQDWSDRIVCGMAKADLIHENDGKLELAESVLLPDSIPGSGNASTAEIPGFIPTRYAKAFHPRTLGQRAYAKLIEDAW